MATTNNDCSNGLCSIHCPQWCYFLFSPPPSLSSSSSSSLSPLNITIITILASFILLLCYYTFISKFCNHLSFHSGEAPPSNAFNDILIDKIAVFRYRKGEGVVELTDCSVCLGEFREEDRLRLLPKCSHAFHLQCIDAWLKSHSSCPLCRADVLQESSKGATFSDEQEEMVAVVVQDEGEIEDELMEVGEEDGEQSSSHGG